MALNTIIIEHLHIVCTPTCYRSWNLTQTEKKFTNKKKTILIWAIMLTLFTLRTILKMYPILFSNLTILIVHIIIWHGILSRSHRTKPCSTTSLPPLPPPPRTVESRVITFIYVSSVAQKCLNKCEHVDFGDIQVWIPTKRVFLNLISQVQVSQTLA